MIFSLVDGSGRLVSASGAYKSFYDAALAAAQKTLGVPYQLLIVFVVEGDGKPVPPLAGLAGLRFVRAQAWGGKLYRVRDCKACNGNGGFGCVCAGYKWKVDTSDVICEASNG